MKERVTSLPGFFGSLRSHVTSLIPSSLTVPLRGPSHSSSAASSPRHARPLHAAGSSLATRSSPLHVHPVHSPTPPSLPRYASVTLLAGRWPLSSPRGGGSSAVRREPTTPVRLASPLATLVPPGRRALRAAYGESGLSPLRSHGPSVGLAGNRARAVSLALFVHSVPRPFTRLRVRLAAVSPSPPGLRRASVGTGPLASPSVSLPLDLRLAHPSGLSSTSLRRFSLRSSLLRSASEPPAGRSDKER